MMGTFCIFLNTTSNVSEALNTIILKRELHICIVQNTMAVKPNTASTVSRASNRTLTQIDSGCAARLPY